MRRIQLHIIFFLVLLLLVAACEEREYYYPSVKLEFVTVQAGADGRIGSLIPDKGTLLKVSEDLTNSRITANSFRRVLSNYEVVASDDGESTLAKVYSLQSVVVPEPKKSDDPAFAGGMKTDPVEVTSIWMGRDYLNMILTVKAKGGKQHVFGIVEDSVEEGLTGKVVTLSLFHNAKGDEEYYSRRVYISVPLVKYADKKGYESVKIRFKYHTYDKNGKVVESDKYCKPGFDYVPDAN